MGSHDRPVTVAPEKIAVPPVSAQARRRDIAPVTATILLAAILPLPLLAQSLWLDEASSVWFARLPLADLLLRLCDPHPPGYYLLLKGWLALGEAEPWLRLLSVFASVLAVVLTARAGRRMLSPRAGLLAALLLATFPLQCWYAAEVRMYALAQALGVALLLPAWQLMSTDVRDARLRWRWTAAGFWMLAVAALSVDVSALLPYAALQLVWLASDRPHAGRWLRLQAAVIVPIAIWWLVQGVGADTYHAIFVAVQARRLGVALDPGSAGLLLRAAAIAAGLLAVALAWQLAAAQGRARRLAGRPLVAYLLLTAWLLLLAFSALPRLFTVKRLLVVILPYLALLLAHRLAQRRPRLAWGTAALGLAVTLWMLATFQREPWRQVIASITEAGASETSVAWVDDLVVPAFDYYVRRRPPGHTAITWAPLLGTALPALPAPAPPPGGDLWLVSAESLYRNLQTFLPAAFYQDYQLVAEQHVPGIGVWRYRRLVEPLAQPPPRLAPSLEATWGLRLPSPLAVCR